MRIIDDKGMLFGKVNVIDFAVLGFICMFLPMFYFGYRFSKYRKPQEKLIQRCKLDESITKYDKRIAELHEGYKTQIANHIKNYESQIADLTRQLNEITAKRDILLTEHKKLRKYFE